MSNLWRSTRNDTKFGTYDKWGILSLKIVLPYVIDKKLFNYSWHLSNLWKSTRSENIFGMYEKWGMMSPKIVFPYVIDTNCINYLWFMSYLWSCIRNGMNSISEGIMTMNLKCYNTIEKRNNVKNSYFIRSNWPRSFIQQYYYCLLFVWRLYSLKYKYWRGG